MLPILQNEVVDKKHWISQEELLNFYSIGQCTPGMIAVNASSFIGFKLRQLPGLISATLGVISPSIIIILLIAMLLRKYMDNQYVLWAFSGVRLSVIALIINTVWDLMKRDFKNRRHIAVFGVTAILLYFFHLSAIFVVVLAALTSLISDSTKKG